MKKSHVVVLLSSVAFGIMVFKGTNAVESSAANTGPAKTVAWYVANIKEAKAQNKVCHDNPGIQASADCANALQALKISFAVNN